MTESPFSAGDVKYLIIYCPKCKQVCVWALILSMCGVPISSCVRTY